MFIMISLHLLREKIVSEHLVVVQRTVRRDISIGCVPMALYYGHYGNDPILLLFPVVVVSDWEAASSCSQPACLPAWEYRESTSAAAAMAERRAFAQKISR